VRNLLEVKSGTNVRWRGNFSAVVRNITVGDGEPEIRERGVLPCRKELPLDVQASGLAEGMGARTYSVLEPETPALRSLAESADQ